MDKRLSSTVFHELGELFLLKRLTQTKSKELATATYRADVFRWQKLLPAFRSKPVGGITATDIESFLDSLILAGKAPGTRNRYRALLHSFYESLVRQDIVVANPVARVPLLSEKLKSREVGYWRTQEEVDTYMRFAAERRPCFGIAAALLCLGGCRISEALSVRWEDIEWDKGFIWIRRILEHHSGEIHQRTKSQRAGGSYPMILVERLAETLLRWKDATPHSRPRDLIVHSEAGKVVTYDQYRKAHQRTVKAAGLPTIRIHDLRRTFAILGDRLGLSRQDVSLLLGHETLDTVDAYLPPDRSYTFEKAKKLGLGARKGKVR